ncbi:MAG TPA: ABC transporter permease [Opitutaceae bacterium]|nr:ABC transporter permease [Opitutaceae bacterium]HND61009.1 ABC transporter permease [Opitutaceae bacterium]
MNHPVDTPRSPPFAWLEQLGQDLRYGLRQLVKSPGFATVSILTIALGIGACTALFSVVNKVVLHPLDYDEPDRIVSVTQNQLPKIPYMMVSPGVYNEWLAQQTVFEQLDASSGGSVKLAQGDRFLQTFAVQATANLFSVYRLKAEKGRLFLPEEMQAGKDKVVILSHGLWKEQFAGRDSVIGETLRLDDETYTIIGVVHDTQRSGTFVYLPCVPASETHDFKSRRLWLEGRLKPGVTFEQAEQEMQLLMRRTALAHPDTDKDYGVTVKREMDFWISGIQTQLYALLGAVAFLLLIACVNVASLLLARANARSKEIAVRAALGAGRGRIVRQFLAESLLIAVAGGILGILLAYASMPPLVELARHFMPHTERVAVDGTVLAVMCGVMLLCGLGFGLVPALQATRGDLIAGIKESGHQASGGRERLRVRNALVVLEISVALVLLISTGLLVRSLRAMQTFDEGLRTEDVWDNQFVLNSQVRYNSPEKILAFTHTMMERVQGLPDVECAALTIGLPMDLGRNRVQFWSFITEGGHWPTTPGQSAPSTDRYAVTPDYFKVMSIPIIRGRGFTAQDTATTTPNVVINREMARLHFADKDPIGQRIQLADESGAHKPWAEIIGIVGDVKPRGPMSPTQPQVYQAFEQNPQQLMTLVIKAKPASPGLSAAVRDIFRSLDKDIRFEQLYDLQGTIQYAWVQQRFNMILFTLFSLLALILAAIGIYGVMAYSVKQRTSEIGIRMALGAQSRDVLRLILASGARVVGIGLLLGTLGALATTRLISMLLFNTSPYDPVSFIGINLILALIALLACYLPARRATKVDPLVALRHE